MIIFSIHESLLILTISLEEIKGKMSKLLIIADIKLRNMICSCEIIADKSLMKRKFKQLWSSIPTISTTWTITSHLNWTHWTQKDHDTWHWKSRSWHGTSTKNVVGLNWLMGSQPSPLHGVIRKQIGRRSGFAGVIHLMDSKVTDT